MRYETQWRDDAENAAPEERATVADLALWIGEQSATTYLHGSEREVHDRVTVALYGLAEGLAHDWWAIFGGRDREFRLIRHRSGYVLPDIRFSFDGAAFEIAAVGRVYDNPGVRFWDTGTEVMTKAAAQAELGGLVEAILQRLDSRGLSNTSAALRWARVRASRENPDEAAFCESAGAFGLDPYQIADEPAASIEGAAELFAGEPLTELLAGAGQANSAAVVEWVGQVERRRPYCARVSDLRSLAQAAVVAAPPQTGEESWALGYRRARVARRIMGLRPAERLVGFRTLAEKLGASRSYELAARVDGVRALRSDRDDGAYLHMRTLGGSAEARTGHSFTFARAAGDVVCFPDETRAPVNDLLSAYRQAAGRAFAAELLAPIDEISSMREDGRDEVSMAEEFGVSTAVIERQIENEKRIRAVVI